MKSLQSNGGMVVVGLVGLFLALGLTILVAWLWPNNERLFSLTSNVAVGFQGSLFTILQIKRAETKSDGSADKPSDEK